MEIADISLTDKEIRAISIISNEHIPTVFLNSNSRFYHNEKAKVFSLVHELCHLLFDREKGLKFAIASGPWAPRKLEQRANAFAAELLMPKAGIGKLVSSHHIKNFNLENVVKMAEEMSVSVTSLLGRLIHLQYIDEETKEILAIEFESQCKAGQKKLD